MCVCALRKRGATRNRLPETPINRDPDLSLSLFRPFRSSLFSNLYSRTINFLDERASRGTGSLLLNAYQSVGSRERSEGERAL